MWFASAISFDQVAGLESPANPSIAKQKKKLAHSNTQSSKAGDLKARLARLPADQLIAIVETFLVRVGEKQRLEFLNLLPAVRSEDLEVHLPYGLLVEALLVEGDYEQAVKQAARSDFPSWDENAEPRRSLLDFFLHSVTRAGEIANYPEIARRLGQPAAFIKRFGKELFRAPLPTADRDRQIDWLVQMLRPRIERIVKGKSQSEYADAAHDTRLIAELHHLQGQSGKGQRFVASLHAQYQRHRNFRAELKKLGLG
jgi:hypothetical protein